MRAEGRSHTLCALTDRADCGGLCTDVQHQSFATCAEGAELWTLFSAEVSLTSTQMVQDCFENFEICASWASGPAIQRLSPDGMFSLDRYAVGTLNFLPGSV